MWQKVIEKMISGRFILTVVASLVFAYCSISGKIPPDKVYDVINIVIVAYFLKGQNNIPKGT